MMNKIFFAILICFVFDSDLFCQELKNCSVSKSEKKSGILRKYQFDSDQDVHIVNLVLYANHTFFYENKSFAYNVHSEGAWYEKNNCIILNSSFQSDNLPIKILYKFDSSSYNQRIEIVQNLRQEELHDALIFVNNDSINCFPDMSCVEIISNKTIDSLKVGIGEIASPWVKILHNDYKRILLVVQSDLNLTKYKLFSNKKYSIEKNYLRPMN